MKKRLYNKFNICLIVMIFLLIIFSINSISAANSVNSCNLNVSLINQDPNPAVPGSYVDIVFQISGVQDSSCSGARFEVVPSYPFSLDNNNTLQLLAGSTYTYGASNVWNIPYSLRVDKNALDGSSELNTLYSSGEVSGGSFLSKKFNIAIKDSRTSFDAVIQQSTGSDVSIAIANTGKYAANSVIVRIPQQDDFMVTGTDGQMVGNLASGDYTLVSFTISSNFVRNMTRGSANPSATTQTNTQQPKNLKFDIYYTDNIGERRTVNMELPLRAGNLSAAGRFGRTTTTTSTPFYLTKTFWIIIIIIIILVYLYKKYPEKSKVFLHKLRDIFSKGSKKIHSANIPDWVKHAKEKEKK